jgi:hypothetical protein
LLSLRRNLLCRILLLFGFLLSLVSSMPAQFPMQLGHPEQGTQPEDIRELVSKYCRLDYEGARLDAAGWEKLQPLVWWKSYPDISQVAVISRYTVSSTPELSHGRYSVTVHYLQMGRFDPAIGYSREASNEDVEFTVTNSGGEWKIYDASPSFPHTSKAAILKWLNGKLAAAPDDATKKVYQDALRQMQTPPAQ